MFKDDENTQAVEFANAFLKRYTNVGFGALPKREVDLMLLQLLQVHLPGFKEKSDFDTAIFLKTTKRKVRGLRDEISFREGHVEGDLSGRLRDVLKTAEMLKDSESMVMVQIDDAVLRGFAEKIIRSKFGVVDSSFNSQILKISPEKYLLLACELLNEDERNVAEAAILEIYNTQGETPEAGKSLFQLFNEGIVIGVGQTTGRLLASGAIALLTNGASLFLEGAEPVRQVGRGIREAINTAREFYENVPAVD